MHKAFARRPAKVFHVALVASATVAVPSTAAQEPADSTVELAPLFVRVLGSSIGTGTPHAVTVAEGEELRRGSADAFLEEALRAVPGVQIQNRFNFAVGERLSIRGFGPRAQFGIRGVRALVDGIPATLPDGQSTLDHLDLSSLGRVEVLRGPNATLYGNAAGGVLHFRTIDPSRQPSGARFGTTAGSHGLLTVQGSANGDVGEGGYRFGFNHLEYDGFRRDPVADDGSTYGKARRSTVNGVASVPAGGGTLRFVVNGVDLDADNPGSLPEEMVGNEDRSAWAFNVRSRTRKEVRQGQLGATWSERSGARTTELSVWGIRRELENPIPGTVIGVDRNAGGSRAIVNRPIGLDFGTLTLGAGAELEIQRDDRVNWENDGGSKGALTLSQLEQVRAAGLFGQLRLDFDGGISLLGGLRYDRIRFSADDRFVEDGDPDDSGSRTMSAISPSGGVVVDAGSGIELFGSVARSFESPTTTELVNRPTGAGGFNPELEPQTGVTFEGGVRARRARWALEATLFRTDLEGELISFEVPTDPGRQYFRNAGASHHTGWEVTAEGTPFPNAEVRVSYTRVDARFERYITDSEDFSGNRIPGLAPHRLDALGSLTHGSGFVEVRALYQDDVPTNDAGDTTADAYVIADLRAGLERVGSGSARLSPYVAISNLFDRRYTGSVTVNAFGGRYFEPGPGRTFRVGVDVSWGG
ncbi:MAG: TonB-dependent receptor [Gemmatimonadota bacterium]|nr:TonB-dependent receptor [Gemmatimonadota bacterium]